MSKVNDIENALLQMEQGRFQKMCNEALQRDGYEGITAWGAVLGKDKTKKGTPDSYILHKNGKYTFIECTTKSDAVAAKIGDDIEKCFDEGHTGVPADKVTRIVVCHNSRLSPSDVEALQNQCSSHTASFVEFNIDRLALELAHKHRALAHEYLGIAIDTGQVLSVYDFIAEYQRSRFATRLDNTFLFREKEFNLLTDALDSTDIVVVAGKAGVGKTKLALQVCGKFVNEKQGYGLVCVSNKNLPLYNDLIEHTGGAGNFLILVDDANRFDRLTDITNLVRKSSGGKKIKLVLTVRDYAKKCVLESLAEFSEKHVMTVGPLESKQIRDILSSDDFGIRNGAYLERISSIAQGNPRLAVMAAKAALDEQRISALQDASSIYDLYFETVVRELKELGDSNLAKVLSIVAYFRIIRRSDAGSYANLCERFGFSELEFWDTVIILHKLEMVDLFEDEIVKIGDQVLATYFIYKVFFRDGLLDFRILLNDFFYSNTELMRDAIVPVVNTFDYNVVCDAIAPILREQWKKVHSEPDKLFPIMEMFWFALRTETLQELEEKVRALPVVSVDVKSLDCGSIEIKDPILGILQRFVLSTEADYKISLELVFLYLEKNPKLFPQVLKYVEEAVLFGRNSFLSDYYVQSHFISELADRANACDGTPIFVNLFMCVGPLFLADEYDASWLEDRRAVTICKFCLQPTDSVKVIRKTVYTFLFAAFGVCEKREIVLSVLFRYKERLRQLQVRELIESDMNIILPFVESAFEPRVFLEALFVCEYIDELKDMGFQHALFPILERFSKSHEMELVHLLENDRRSYRSDMLYQEYKEFQRRRIEEFFSGFNVTDYKNIFASCEAILRSEKGLNRYQVDIGVYFGLCTLLKSNMSSLLEILETLLVGGNSIRLGPFIIRDILRIDPRVHHKLFAIIFSVAYAEQEYWIATFFEALPEELVNGEYLAKFTDFVQTCPLAMLNLNYDALQKFERVYAGFLLKTVRMIFSRVKAGGVEVCPFQSLFNPCSECAKMVSSIFADDFALLEEIYLHENIAVGFDYNGAIMAAILERNPSFIQNFLKSKTDRKGYLSVHDDVRDYNFLWNLPNHADIADNLFEFAIRDKARVFLGSFHYLMGFFPAKPADETKKNILAYLKARIVGRPLDVSSLRLCFLVMASRYKAERSEMLHAFLAVNSDYITFKQLELEKIGGVAHGSFVPKYEEQMAFWESIHSLFDRPELLKHRGLVEERISAYKERIRYEKRRDFEEEVC